MDAVAWVPIPMEPSLIGLTKVRLLSQAQGFTSLFITSFINNMRKIEREMIQAIIDRSHFSKANTKVQVHVPMGVDSRAEMRVYLHDNHIATYANEGLYINHQGWKTNTTKSRLNALIQFVLGGLSGIYQKDFEWYLKKVDGGNGKVETSPVPDTWLLV